MRFNSDGWSRSAGFPVVLGVMTVAAVLLVSVGVRGQAQTTHHSALPQITTGGQADWPQHNLDIQSSRYAPLDEINTSNVSRLALRWSFEAGAANNISQVTPLVVDGVMYVNAGSTLFAVNAITGETVWTLEMDDSLEARGRGPVYGDGRLYAFGGATMYATDVKTGELVESFGEGGRLEIVSDALQFKYPDSYPPDFDAYEIGYRLTTPPVYFDDTLYTGVALSENNIPGGLVVATDATTGAIKWVFNTVPQRPSDDGWEIANDTWGDAPRVGGGVWTPPAIDAELGLVYVNSGNPSPDYDGSGRPGMNLFTNATIALELETGRLAWYYQAVHHDVWDWDHVTGPTLFDVTTGDGRTIKGIAAAGKNCLMYLWHRETGEPINPIVEMVVPTETNVPGEQVWPTQPIPYTSGGVPMTPFCATYPLVSDPEAKKRARQMYTPYSTTEFYIVSHGGGSWGPPSFSPRTGLLYMTGKDSVVAFTVNPIGDSVEVGVGDGHSDTIAEGPIRDDMTPLFTVTAYEPATGNLVWQQRMPTASAIGSSGNLVTAGNLVLQGTDVGKLYAFDARTGDELFVYEHNRPIRASPLTYQVNGTQYVSVVSTNDVLTFAVP